MELKQFLSTKTTLNPPHLESFAETPHNLAAKREVGADLTDIIYIAGRRSTFFSAISFVLPTKMVTAKWEFLIVLRIVHKAAFGGDFRKIVKNGE